MMTTMLMNISLRPSMLEAHPSRVAVSTQRRKEEVPASRVALQGK